MVKLIKTLAKKALIIESKLTQASNNDFFE